MLRHLRVTNFAILSDVSLDLSGGLTVLTGETGAGKSLIVDAVNLLRGGRASADIPRAGADEAVVEALFDVPDDLADLVAGLLAEAGLPAGEPGELVVRRVIHRGGKSRTWINGALTTAGRLAELGAVLVDLSGQHEHQGLVDPKRHLAILDGFAARPEDVAAMAVAWDRLAAIDEERAALTLGDPRAVAERVEYLRFQLDELDAADLAPGEDESLAVERLRLLAGEKLHGAATAAEDLVYGGDGAAIERIDGALRELGRVASIDDRLAGPSATLGEARALCDDAARALRDYLGHLGGDPERLAEVDERLALIARLRRKHGGQLADVIARRQTLAAELGNLGRSDERLAELDAERAAAAGKAQALAAGLTAIRRQAAERLGREVEVSLGELGMPAAKLVLQLEPRDLGSDGADRVEFLLSPNRGEGQKPLAKIASGGELSRIMLAIKLALRRAYRVATYVFDEVDAGIGGATAEVVGRKIAALARQRQVLCVTHLPQIAAFADQHVHVAKAELGGRTETIVTTLAADARRDELARMVGGRTVTAEARAHALAMLAATVADRAAPAASVSERPSKRAHTRTEKLQRARRSARR
jgi:DNA repair protein RecN (Recombination protein N)